MATETDKLNQRIAALENGILAVLDLEADSMDENPALNRLWELVRNRTYCHACSKAGGADRAIYHLPPICADTPLTPHAARPQE